MKKRVLFLLSDTGGGHRAAAQAIAEGIHTIYPNAYETFIEDIWKAHAPWPVNKIPNAYPWLTGPGLSIWKLLWSVSAHFHVHKFILPGISFLLEQKVIRYLKTIRPDLVVSVHPFMNHLGLSWLNKMNFSKSQAACIGLPAVVNPPQAWRDPLNLDIPFVTVVTDMVSIHPLWICPEVTRCIVPTEIAKVWAIKFGMPAEKVEVCGQPVSLKFAQISGDKQAIRRKLGLDLNRPAVMVMGGGEGFGRIFEIARAVAQTVPQSQLLIVSGRNKGLKARLEAVAWEIPTCVYGFVHNMPELMRAADILITKAGPGTINEAFTVGLPPLICGFIPGQEKGNVAYVEEHQAGVYAETPQEIARLVRDWLDPSNHTLQRMAHNAARLARPDAALAIASRLCNVA